MARKKREAQGCALDMTPMIDVVFQLIIFFIVTMNMVKKINEDIYLADGKFGEIIKDMPPSTFEIEVDRRGRISYRGVYITPQTLDQMLKFRVNRYGRDNIPLLIRGDQEAKHEDIKKVMDLCTANALWRISFVAVEKRKKKSRR
jgi:biopolymer transport protein ExbD